MRWAIAAIPGLVVTLALFFLMQLLISGEGRDISKPVTSGGVGLVTLIRDTVGGAGQGTQPSPIPPMPAPTVVPPAPPPPTMAEINLPAEPYLTTDIAAPVALVIEAQPYLGRPPVAAAKKPVAPAMPKAAKKKAAKKKVAKAKPAKKKSSKGSPSAQTKGKSASGGKSARASRGKTAAGAGLGSGGKRGKGRSGRGSEPESSGSSNVVILSRPKPAYPRKALRNKKEGWVKVSFTVTEKGRVADPKVVAAKPRRVFDRSALQAIRNWRFKPKTVGGKPVRAKATQVIQFSLAKR